MTALDTIKAKWRSGNLVGDAQHALVIRVRKGYMERGYMDDTTLSGQPIFPPLIWKGQNHHCWKARWTPTGDWITLPNVQSEKHGRSFKDKGVSTATVVVDNVAFVDTEGPLNELYHTIERGYFSPMKGVSVMSRPSRWQANAWANVLNGGYQIEVWEGYGSGAAVQVPNGSSIVKTWTGLIETCDLESHPDHITITARDFGLLLTDQRLMGYNKDKAIRAPITFADRKQTQGEEAWVGTRRTATSGIAAIGAKTGIGWTSDGHASPNHQEYIEFDLKWGHYEEFVLQAGVAGYEMWCSVYAKHGSWRNDSQALPEGWVDLGFGNIPGDDSADNYVTGSGGLPFLTHIRYTDAQPHRFPLGPPKGGLEGIQGFDFAEGSKLRITLGKLRHTAEHPHDYRAQLGALYALRFGSNPLKEGAHVQAKHWILVEDAAEVVKMILIWAGFREFHVDHFGWTLAHPLVFHENTFYMDVIDEITKIGNVCFYMDAPTGHDQSIGVPRFELQTTTDPRPRKMIDVRDTDMSEALQVTWDMSDLPYIIRFRGDLYKKGATLDEDQTKRWTGVYYPPWSRQYSGGGGPATDRTAGVFRQFSQTMGMVPGLSMESWEECVFACVLEALFYGLQMCTAELQIAGLPAFQLNRQINVVDAADGFDGRMWVASIENEHTMGPQGKWTMKVSGSALDTQDMQMIAHDYGTALKKMRAVRKPSFVDGSAPPTTNV